MLPNKIGYTVAAAIVALLSSDSVGVKAGFNDRYECKNGPISTVRDLSEAVKANDTRLVACFNYMLEILAERDERINTQLRLLQSRIDLLEVKYGSRK